MKPKKIFVRRADPRRARLALVLASMAIVSGLSFAAGVQYAENGGSLSVVSAEALAHSIVD